MPIQRRAVTNQNYRPEDPASFRLPVRRPQDGGRAPIVVLCEPPTVNDMRHDLPMSQHHLSWFARHASELGFVESDFIFLGLCPPIPKSEQGTVKKRWEFVSQYGQNVHAEIEAMNPEVIVTLGDLATRTMMERAVKITKLRGQVWQTPRERQIFPMLSPRLCTRVPDNEPIFDADLSTLMRFKRAGYDTEGLKVEDVDYQWVTDLQFLLDNPPAALAVDSETTGLNVHAEDFRVLLVQLTPRPGVSYLVPMDVDYWPMPWRQRERLRLQLKQLLENPEIKKLGQNLKYDHQALSIDLDINVAGWTHDTELLARAVNENFLQYNIDDLVRIYVPEMAGFNDEYNARLDKNDMRSVSHEDMLMYAGGDTDATFRLARALQPMLAKDPGQHFLYQKVMMRGLTAFAKVVERFGQRIDREALIEYEREVTEWVQAEEEALFMTIPRAIRRKWLTGSRATSAKGERSVQNILFGKAEFLIDVLFSPPWGDERGFGLEPKVFTASTAEEQDPSKRVPSTSAKDHLPYFEDAVAEVGTAGNFVFRLIQLKKASKLLSTYIKGFYKYIRPTEEGDDCEKIYPSYNFRTNTFRTNSADPNGQNFPKRGQFAKGFLKLICASPGKVLVAADLSQVELRLTAWTAMEQVMLNIYRNDGDIHEATAAAVSRVDIDTFKSWKGSETPLIDVANDVPGSGVILQALRGNARREYTLGSYYALQRFRAKAVNFGFIYGAQWRTFQTYAKTQYGVDYTNREAQLTREVFFNTYDLIPWHQRVEHFVKRNGFVRTLHGGIRHLPGVRSDDPIIASGAVRQAINAPIQRFGSDLGVMAIARLAAQCDPAIMRPVGFVHDQVICECDPGYADEGMGHLVWVMENPPLEEWFGIQAPLPFRSDPEIGMNLAETEEIGRSQIDVVKPDWWIDDEEAVWDVFTNMHDEDAARELVQLRV